MINTFWIHIQYMAAFIVGGKMYSHVIFMTFMEIVVRKYCHMYKLIVYLGAFFKFEHSYTNVTGKHCVSSESNS